MTGTDAPAASTCAAFFACTAVALAALRRKSTGIVLTEKEAKAKELEVKLVTAFTRTAPTDWSYIAEGALNLALKYVGNQADLKGYVLRVRKDNPEATGGKKCPSNPWISSMEFTEKMIVPFLGRRYVQPSIQVPLYPDFISQLGVHINDSRPVKRRKNPLEPNLRVGLLMPDNTCIPMPKTNKEGGEGEHNAVCFEIKCKWGFLPTSPFITHPVKTRVNRFVMHQQMKFDKGKLDTHSQYNPLELFSADMSEVKKALMCLVKTPQNNFRLFVDGEMVFPDAHGHGDWDQFQSVVAKLPQFKKNQTDAAAVIDLLSSIFASEPLFDRIKQAQQLDDLDIEGTWKVYQNILDKGEDIGDLSEGPALTSRPPPKELPTNLKDELDAVRRFLVSCTAKDCSVMIVVQPSTSQTSNGTSNGKVAQNGQGSTLRSLLVEMESERVVVRGYKGFDYSIAVVDLDPKPKEKLQHYFELDAKIAEHYRMKEVAAEEELKMY